MVYEYVLRDHSRALGGRGPQASPGVTFGDLDEDGSPEVLQQDHYYPGVYPGEAGSLAMKTPGGLVAAPPNQYRYNGGPDQTSGNEMNNKKPPLCDFI